MSQKPLSIEQIRSALAGLEAQRALLGDAVVEPAMYALRQQLAALEAQAQTINPAQERRLITILFSDVVGSVSLAEQLDPEDWRQVIAQVQSAIGTIVVERHGLIAQYQGDALIALFGARDLSEDDAENAVRTGLAAQQAVAQLKLLLPVQIRVGIHTGLVVLGEWGVDARIEFGAFGDAVNVAARLQTSAPPGGVLISRDTYRHVRGIFDLVAQPPLTLKGKREPMQTYVVQGVRPRPFRIASRGVSGLETATIGRDAELNQLQQAYRHAYEQRQAAWMQLSGEAGVGKSRLVAEMDDWIELRPEDVCCFRARSFSGDIHQPWALIRHLWFEYFHIAEDEPLAQAEAKWVQGFQELIQTDEVEPAQALGLLVGLPFKDSPHLGVLRDDPVQVKGRAFVVSQTVFNLIRAEQPIFMLLEDLHWADSASLDYLLKTLLDNDPHDHGLFVLATARPEWQPPDELAAAVQVRTTDVHDTQPLRGDLHYFQMTLAPLSTENCRELVQALLQHLADVPDSLVQLIAERAEGVPYYAEELINLLLDRGVIDSSAEPWLYDPHKLDVGQLPQTLQYLLLTRLLSLSVEQRTCLQRGSIFGRHFWEGGLKALDVPDPRVALGPLQTRAMVDAWRESAFEGEREWSFHHSLLCDVAYESVLKSERRILHKAAAAWLEEQTRRAGRLDEFVDRLGAHAESAGELEAAVHWYVQAGERASVRGATNEARAFFERTLKLVNPSDHAHRWRALLGLDDVLMRLGDTAAHRANVEELIGLANELDDKHLAEAHYRHGIYLDTTGNYREALSDYEAGLELAQRTHNIPLEARLLGYKAICQNRLGDAVGAARAAQAVVERINDADEVSAIQALNNVAIYYVESGDLSRAVELHREQVALTHRLGDRAKEANALNNLGYDYVCLGLSTEARTVLEQSLQIYQSIGAQRELLYARLNLGLAYWRSGDLATARQQLEQVAIDTSSSGDAFARAASLSYLALTLEQAGDTEGAIKCFREADQQFGTLGVRGYALDAEAGLARCLSVLGQTSETRAVIERLWDDLQQNGTQGAEFAVWAFLTCFEVFEEQQQFEPARAVLAAGYQELMNRANKISDAQWRTSFLQNVPEHRMLSVRWQRQAKDLPD